MSVFGLILRHALVAGGVLSAFVSLVGAQVAARTAGSPPDFSSNQAAWRSNSATGFSFIGVPGSPSRVTGDPAHPFIDNSTAERTGQQPTFPIADLSNPNLKQWAKDLMKKDNDEVLAGKIADYPGSSCKPAGVTALTVVHLGPYFFIQTQKEVLLIEESDRHARRIYMNVPHSSNVKPSWYGESVGHYEGDTLVVDTIGMNNKTIVDGYRTPHTEKLHVVERWRLIDQGKTLEVHMTIEDPDTYYQPWQVIRRFGRVQATLGEDICAENNRHLFDYGIPEAKTPDF